MSYANGTTFYNLPQTIGTDKRDWFDTNNAFLDIDTALHGVVEGQETDAQNITNLQGRMTTAEGNITTLQGNVDNAENDISTLQLTVLQHTSDIADVRQDAEDMITAYNEGASATSTRAYSNGDYFIYNDVLYRATTSIAVGDTIVPNTNCSATNTTSEIAQLNSDLSNLANVYIEIPNSVMGSFNFAKAAVDYIYSLQTSANAITGLVKWVGVGVFNYVAAKTSDTDAIIHIFTVGHIYGAQRTNNTYSVYDFTGTQRTS